MGEFDKERLLRVRDYILQNSDEDTGFTVKEIQEVLLRNGLSADKTTLYRDFETLKHRFGMEIRGRKGSRYWYYMNNTFSFDDLALIRESINSAAFLTEEEAEALIKKMATIGTGKQGSTLSTVAITRPKVKRTNIGNVIQSLETISYAMGHDFKISFSVNEAKEIDSVVHKVKMGQKTVVLSPFEIIKKNDDYVITGVEEGNLIEYSTSKMANLTVLNRVRREGREIYNQEKKLAKIPVSSQKDRFTLHVQIQKKDIDEAQKMMDSNAEYYCNHPGYIDIFTKIRLDDKSLSTIAGLLSFDGAKINGGEEVINAYRSYIQRQLRLMDP